MMEAIGKFLRRLFKRSYKAQARQTAKISPSSVQQAQMRRSLETAAKADARQVKANQQKFIEAIQGDGWQATGSMSQAELGKAFVKDRLFTGKNWKTAETKAMFEREKKTYNAKISRQLKKYQARYGVSEEDILQTGLVPRKITAKWADIQNRDALKAVMNAMIRAREGKMIGLATKEARQTTRDIIMMAYYPDKDQMLEIADILGNMSVDDIMDFRMTHPDLVRNYFLRYRERMGSKYDMSPAQAAEYASISDDETTEKELKRLLEALREYAK